jgi:hypothetical protein
MKQRFNLKKQPVSENLMEFLTDVVNATVYSAGPQKILFGNIILPLVLCIFVLLFARHFPHAGIATIIVCARLPGVFLLAPASKFKYVYSVYLFAFFLIPLMVLDWRKRDT